MQPTISNLDKLECLRRELRLREKVYPRWIIDGRITPEKARHELEVMAAIMQDYEPLAAKERLL